MKKNSEETFLRKVIRWLGSIKPSMWFFVGTIVIAAVGLFLLGPSSIGRSNSLKSVEAGKIAETDIYAGKDTVYTDKEATQRKILAEERLVLAVFVLDDKITSSIRERRKPLLRIICSLSMENPEVQMRLDFY